MRAPLVVSFVCVTMIASQSPDLATRVRALGRELRVEVKDDPDVYARAVARGGPAELDRLLRDLTAATLNSSPQSSIDAVRRQLRDVYAPWPIQPGNTEGLAEHPDVIEATLAGKRVAFVTWVTRLGGSASPSAHAQILAFLAEQGRWRFVAQTGEFLNNSTVFVASVKSLQSDESWIVAYGSRIGNTRNPTSVALLAFDGRQFKRRWGYDDLFGGIVQVLPSGLRLEYRAYFAPGANFIEVAENLSFVPEGMKVQSREIKR